LWRYTYDYLTTTKRLDHLVWLHGYNGEPQASFYPGK
jgi:beta-mannanase